MNRHLKIAFFMAPLLAIGAYVITGYLITTESVQTNPKKLNLIANCLPTENTCVFHTADIELKLISNEQKNQYQLAVISTQSINNLSLALGQNDTFIQFPMMKTDNNRYWQIKLNASDNIKDYQQLRLAFTYKNNNYFAESAVIF